jgi:prepilin-type N-terminal cleavage/methylation domain-containing protein
VSQRRQHGITLVELLIAAAILSVLLGVLAAAFGLGARGYRATSDAALVQQRSEIASTLLSYEVGLAGYRGVGATYASNTFTTPTHRLVITRGSGGASDSIRTRYYEDRFLQTTGATTVVRDVTYSIGAHGGVSSLLRTANGTTHPAIIGVTDLRVPSVVRADGTRLTLGTTLPTTNPAVALELVVTMLDGSVTRFTVGFQNIDLADTTHVAIQ